MYKVNGFFEMGIASSILGAIIPNDLQSYLLYALGGLSISYHFIDKLNGWDIFCRNTGLINKDGYIPTIKNKKHRSYGTDIKIKLPPGVSITEIEKRKEHLKSYFNSYKLNFNVKHKEIIIESYTKQLRNDFKYKPIKPENPLDLILGYNFDGVVKVDLTKGIPHMLLGGATGQGKSNLIKNIIVNIVKHFTPEEIELILIDLKRVELNIFKDLEHTICFEDNNMNRVLHKLHNIMEERYKLLEEKQVNNIQEYNKNNIPLPYQLIIIDEIQDIMGNKKLLESLTKLAAKCRGVGMHLLISTQRPSIDVLPGTLKNNLQVRVSFGLSTETDSRVILDDAGAEELTTPGRGILKVGKDKKEFQAMYLSTDCIKEHIKPYTRTKEDDKCLLAEKLQYWTF